jgi:AcrR family transcriptional regulator
MGAMAGRPREFDTDRALETILRAFWRDGFDRITIARLVAETGVAAPSLYAAFGDKRAMFELASARYIDRLDTALRHDLDADTSRQAIANVLRSAAQNFAEASQPAGCLVMAEPALAQRRQITRDAIRDRLRQGRRDGELAEDPDEVSEYVNTVLAGMAARAREGATQESLTSVAHQTLGAIAFAPHI